MKTNKSTWEEDMTYTEKKLEEFDEKFTEVSCECGARDLFDFTELKVFLTTSITQAVAEERERVRGEIEGMKNKKHVCESREGWECEYETAIDDILSSLEITSPNPTH